MISKTFSQTLKFVPKGFRSLRAFSTATTGGNLYTWGTNTSALGYSVPQTTTSIKQPRRVNEFDGNVAKVVMGPAHSAVITTEGDLYTFGAGGKGMLGHGKSGGTLITPKRVDFFAEKGLKIKDVVCGETYTVALTENGEIYSWGSGGKESSLLMKLFFPSIGALGHGTTIDKELPTRIESLKKHGPFVGITGGFHFVQALNDKHELYDWGRGEYGVFGNGSNKNLAVPQLNDNLERMKVDDNLSVVKVKSANTYTLALMTDGIIYGWGANEFGQMGIKSDIGVELYETAPYPTAQVTEDTLGKKVVDFKLGENTAITLYDTNEVYWSGLRLAYKPEKLNLRTDKKVKDIIASYGSVAVVLDDNSILMRNTLLPSTDEDLDTGILTADVSGFEGGNIVDIGGSYRNKYAIVKH